jgi:hypothetical protein
VIDRKAGRVFRRSSAAKPPISPGGIKARFRKFQAVYGILLAARRSLQQRLIAESQRKWIKRGFQ